MTFVVGYLDAAILPCLIFVGILPQIRKYLIESLNHNVMCDPRIIFSLQNWIISLMDVGNGVVLEMRDGIDALW